MASNGVDTEAPSPQQQPSVVDASGPQEQFPPLVGYGSPSCPQPPAALAEPAPQGLGDKSAPGLASPAAQQSSMFSGGSNRMQPQQQQLRGPPPGPQQNSVFSAGLGRRPPQQHQRQQLRVGPLAHQLPSVTNFNDDDEISFAASWSLYSMVASLWALCSRFAATVCIPADPHHVSLLAEQPEPDPVVASEAVLSVVTRVEYSALPNGETQDVFGLVTVQAAAAPEPAASANSGTQRQPMDLMCVLDVSSSMSGEKIQQLQSAVRFIIEQADPNDRLSIVTFNSSANRVLRFRKMDAEGKNEATVTTLRLSAGGGTSIAAGLGTGLSVMEQRRQRNKVSAILVLTDGQDGSTRHQLPNLMTRAKQANCSVYAFGFGRDHDAALLSDLAEQAQTPFTFVENADNIREAFAGAVGGLTSIVAQSVELTIAGCVPLKNVHTAFTIQRTSDTNATVLIPDIFAGERRDILVELVVPAVADAGGQTKLLESHVRYTDLRSGSTMRTEAVVMEALRVDEPQPEAEPDEEVAAQRERVEVTRALQEASAQSDRGQFDEAQRVLDLADKHVKSKKKATKMSEAMCEEIADAQNRMRSRSMWEGGGRAEIHDACQMHKMQRCTNMMAQPSAQFDKRSKAMYCQAAQVSHINQSKR